MIVATAGHVDHGKTSLVKQLTGVDTDRLEEEKRRGLTIELGFAYRKLNDGVTLGFIDVPGHSRFINTMIAGVNGIDLGMLVVAADDGIMPQTREHLDVMQLLGVTAFIGVITKVDRVEATRVDELALAIKALLPGGVLEVFPVSNVSHQGVPELQRWLDQRATTFKPRRATGNFRLPVDRAFSLKGVGLVVTGTAVAGRVAVGDELEVLPAGEKVRVRSLRVRDCEAQSGQAGDRCALNIVGSKDVRRGSMLSAINCLSYSSHLDVRFSLLTAAPFSLKHLSPAKLYIGTQRLACRIFFIEPAESGQLEPGQEVLAQLILAEPISCCNGDLFLIRDDSESVTLGGGMVLDPLAPKEGKSRQHRLAYLAAMQLSSPALTLKALQAPASPPLNLSQWCKSLNLTAAELELLLGEVSAKRFDVGGTQFAISEQAWKNTKQTVLSLVQQWHGENPQDKGIAVLVLQRRFLNSGDGLAGNELFQAVTSSLVRERILSLAGGLISTASYKPLLSSVEQGHWGAVQTVLQKQGMAIPSLADIADTTRLKIEQVHSAVRAAARINLVHKVSENRYALSAHLHKHARVVAQLGELDDGITVVNYKNKIGSGRKLAIEILEYFDMLRYTQRRGECRVILDQSIPDTVFGE